MSGSSCATTGSPIVSSGPTTTSLSTVATPGTNSSISLGPSCRSACATGPTGSDQRDLVLTPPPTFRGAFLENAKLEGVDIGLASFHGASFEGTSLLGSMLTESCV